MFKTEDKAYKCSLSQETLAKAMKELNETPDTRIYEVKCLRSRVMDVPGLKPRTDVNFLLPFLRVKKFEQERTFQHIQSYYGWKREHGYIFDDLKPSRIRQPLDTNMCEVLRGRDKQGCRIFLFRAENWDVDRFSITELLKLFSVILMNLKEEEETQVHGIHYVLDMRKLTWHQACTWTPHVAKFTVRMIQNIIPLRMKRVDYLDAPRFFDDVFKIFKLFLNKKIAERVHFNYGNWDKFYSSVDRAILPTDIGGEVEPYSNKEWKESLLNSEHYFEEDNKYGFLEMGVADEKSEVKHEDADLHGLGGAYKKLDIS